MYPQTDQDLIRKSCENDFDAFRLLVERHQSMVYSVAFRLLCDEDNAKDAAQETFIRVWKNITAIKVEMRFSTWLYKIVTNICLDLLKSEKRRKNHFINSEEKHFLLEMASEENIEKTMINSEICSAIQLLTQELSPKQKLVFTLKEIEGLEVDEISKITGLTAEKIKSNLYCARQFIKTSLEKL